MVMSTRPMDMAVGKLLLRCLPHIGDLHVEMQCDTSQRVVPVQCDDTIVNTDNGEHAHIALFGGTRLELHAGFHVLSAKTIHRHLVDQGGIQLTITFSSRYYGHHLVSGLASFKLPFQTRHYHLVSLNVGEGIATGAGVQQLTVGIIQRVVKGDNGVLGDVHGRKVGTAAKSPTKKPRTRRGLNTIVDRSLYVLHRCGGRFGFGTLASRAALGLSGAAGRHVSSTRRGGARFGGGFCTVAATRSRSFGGAAASGFRGVGSIHIAGVCICMAVIVPGAGTYFLSCFWSDRINGGRGLCVRRIPEGNKGAKSEELFHARG